MLDSSRRHDVERPGARPWLGVQSPLRLPVSNPRPRRGESGPKHEHADVNVRDESVLTTIRTRDHVARAARCQPSPCALAMRREAAFLTTYNVPDEGSSEYVVAIPPTTLSPYSTIEDTLDRKPGAEDLVARASRHRRHSALKRWCFSCLERRRALRHRGQGERACYDVRTDATSRHILRNLRPPYL